jgi:hypothetical protein
LPLWTTTAIRAQHSYRNSVTVHDPGHLSLGEEDILTPIIGHHKAKAIAVPLYRAHAIAVAGNGWIRFTHARLSQLRSLE